MKNRMYLFILLSFLATSCDDFLTEKPTNSILADEAINSEKELYLNTVATLYNHIGEYEDSKGLIGTGRGVYDLNTFTTDEAIMPTRGGDWYDGGFWQGLFLHQWGVNNTAIQKTWEYLYQVVMNCNESLESIQRFSESHPTVNVAPYQAEVKAIRAMYYYYLLDLFGRVPLVLDTKQVDLEQSERSELFKFVVKELQAALPLLSISPSNRPGDYYGRLTRPVAYFLLAKLALNAEVYADNNWTDGQRLSGKKIFFTVNNMQLNAWQTTIAYCDAIEALGYRLENKYTTNFQVYNEISSENIFTIPMDKMLYTNQMIYLFRSRHYKHAQAYGLGGENGSSATIEALNTFGYATDHVDPRFDFCYFSDKVYDLKGKPVVLDDGSPLVYMPREVDVDISNSTYVKTAGARMKKYEIDKNAMEDGKLMDNDIVLYRYADVLLMKSEAKVRQGMSGDVELNLVRSRVGVAPISATLETLLQERQLELAWEGWRRQDLIRFNRFTRSYTSRPQLLNEENGYTTVFPISSETLKMNIQLKQNPGYSH